MWRGIVCHVFTPCDLCQQDVSVKLGGTYIQLREATGTFEELQGRSSDVAEGLDCALEVHEKLSDVEGI